MILTENLSCRRFNCISSNEAKDLELNSSPTRAANDITLLSSWSMSPGFPFSFVEELKSMGSRENCPSNKILLAWSEIGPEA